MGRPAGGLNGARMTTTETYTRDEQDRAIDWAFQMGFGNALAQLDGDLQPPRHGRRRRCCTPCRVLDTAAAKLRDGSIPVLGAAHVEDAPDGRGTRGVRGHAPGARHLRHPSSRGPGRPKSPSPPSDAPLSGTWARLRSVCGAPWSPQHDRLAASTAGGDGAETGSGQGAE